MPPTSTSPPKTNGGDAPADRSSSVPPAGAGLSRGRDPLLAAICHDLRAPLAAVTMGANFVLQTTPEDAPNARSRRVLSAMLRSCKQMERLVRDFGDLSEIESDAVVLRPGIHDGAEVLALACEGARANAAERGVEIAVERPPEAVLLRCDRDRILRALAHVIENAVRFAPKETAVALQVREQAGEVRFSVTDCGPGLDAETLQHLYDRQWHGKRADRVGAGLGLAIARGFILAHGGRIDVQSEPGATTFVLAVPKDAPSVPDLARAR